MQSDLVQQIDRAMQRPSRAMVLGFSMFAVLLTVAWMVSGDRLDRNWLSLVGLPVFFGLFLAGVAARRNPLKRHGWIYNMIVLPLLAVSMLTADNWGPTIAAVMSEHPTFTLVLLLNAIVWIYHVMIGIVYLTCEIVRPDHWVTKKPRIVSEP